MMINNLLPFNAAPETSLPSSGEAPANIAFNDILNEHRLHQFPDIQQVGQATTEHGAVELPEPLSAMLSEVAVPDASIEIAAGVDHKEVIEQGLLAAEPEIENLGILRGLEETSGDAASSANPAITPLSASIMQSINYMKNTVDRQSVPQNPDRVVAAPETVVANIVDTVFADEATVRPQATEHNLQAKLASAPSAAPVVVMEKATFAHSVAPDNTVVAQTSDGPRVLAPAPASALTAQLSSPVSTQEWNKQLGDQLIRMSRSGNQQMEIRLNPSELGPLSITLKMNDASQAQAQFVSQNAIVRQALEVALPQLREALSEQGIQLAQADVGERHSGQYSQKQDMNRQDGSGNLSAEINAESSLDSASNGSNHDGLISTYA